MKKILAGLVGVLAIAVMAGSLVAGTPVAAVAAENPSRECLHAQQDPIRMYACNVRMLDPEVHTTHVPRQVFATFRWDIGTGMNTTFPDFIDHTNGGPVSVVIDWGDGTAPTVLTGLFTHGTVGNTGQICWPTGYNRYDCQSLSHTYSQPGSYTVSFTARLHLKPDASGHYIESEVTAPVYFQPLPPIVAWAPAPPSMAKTGETITAKWTVSASDVFYSTSIDWGDGTPRQTVADGQKAGRTYTATHTYVAAGDYRPSVMAHRMGDDLVDRSWKDTGVKVIFDVASAPVVTLAPAVVCTPPPGGGFDTCTGVDAREIRPGIHPVSVTGYMSATTANGPYRVVVSWGDGHTDTRETPCVEGTWCSLLEVPSYLMGGKPPGYMAFTFRHDYTERVDRPIQVTITDASGVQGFATATATAAVKPQLLTLSTPQHQSFPGVDQEVRVSSSAMTPVALYPVGPCTIASSVQNGFGGITAMIRATGVGTCTLIADQPGNDYYLPAEPVSKAFVIGMGENTIDTIPIVAATYLDPDIALAATAGTPVTFDATGACTVTGATLRLAGAGTCSVTARAPGDRNWNAAPDVAYSFEVAKAAQTIGFAAPAGLTFGHPDLPLTAAASSRLPVAYAAVGACAVAGPRLRVLGEGMCLVTARQDGDDDFLPADVVSHIVPIGNDPRLITAITEGELIESRRGAVSVPETAYPGDEIPVSLGAGYDGDQVVALLFSVPTTLGHAMVVDGAFTTRMPATAAIGTHKVVVVDANGDLIGWDDIRILAFGHDANGGSPRAGLAATGMDGDAKTAALSATLLLLIGALLVRRARARGGRSWAGTTDQDPASRLTRAGFSLITKRPSRCHRRATGRR